MALSPGTKLGPYEVLASVGAGGMGEVYRARDTTLRRDVALKILPDALAADPDRVQRFTREAQTLAALNHPNIAQVHGFEDRGDTRALVMEFVEGEDLAARLIHGPLVLSDALSIARQIADALGAAHEQGIVHRDLKPANIKIRPDGTVKVLDFGLAKFLDPFSDVASDISRAGVTASPTITSPAMTRSGVILGTAAYMSPEQAKGRPADKRSDIWAFGCVLYEMLTGARPFDAPDIADTLAAVLTRDPDWARLPTNLPRSIHLLLRRCFERDRARRLPDIAGALFALDEALEAPASQTEPSTRARSRLAYAGWAVAAVVAIAAALAVGRQSRLGVTDATTMRLQIATPPGSDPVTFALSPDGRSIVFSATVEGRPQLHLRRLDADENRVLAGTDFPAHPFWSPDSMSVAFFAVGSLKRLDLASGFVRTLASAPDPRTGAWNADGTILFSSSAGPLYKLSAEGGPVEDATTLLPGQSSHRFPQFLPDGRRFVLLALGESSVRGVYAASLDSQDLTRVTDGDPAFTLLPPSHLLLTHQGALWAQRFNAVSASVEGARLPVAPAIFTTQVTGLAALSSSSVVSFAYRASAESRQLVWLDRAGTRVGDLGPPDPGQPNQLSLSPDGRTVGVVRTVNGNRDVWLVDSVRASFRRFTFNPAFEGHAVFSPDNSRIVYPSDPKGTLWDLYVQRADGTGGETLLRADAENEIPEDWSPDGRHLLYVRQDPKTDFDLWALPLVGDRTPIPIARTPFSEGGAQFAPSGRWVVFASTETGRPEIYVQPFPGPGAKTQISVAGGLGAQWPRGGRELFYLGLDYRLMAVTMTEQGSSISSGVPRALLTLRDGEEFLASNDGQRFLVNRIVADPSPITIVLNWKPPAQP